MPKTTPRLTADDLDTLRALAAGRADSIPPVSRYWLSIYELIDETPQGWQLTERGRAFLRAPVLQQRIEAIAADDPRVLAAAAAAAHETTPSRRRRRRLPWAG